MPITHLQYLQKLMKHVILSFNEALDQYTKQRLTGMCCCVRVCVCMYVYVYVCVCVCMCVCVSVYGGGGSATLLRIALPYGSRSYIVHVLQ